jgi:hypothetical protein
MAIVFDPATYRIILDTASVSAVELYSRSADWLALSDNVKYGPVFRQVGGDDLGGGLSIPPYVFLQGLWRVRPMEVDHDLVITGNLFVDGGGIPVVRTLGPYQVNVNYTVPVQAQGISTGGGSAPSAATVAAAVWASIIEGSFTAQEAQRILLAVLAGKSSGIEAGTPAYRNLGDTKNRVAGALDANGNRLSVTIDAT